jgi:hypothetical protein
MRMALMLRAIGVAGVLSAVVARMTELMPRAMPTTEA